MPGIEATPIIGRKQVRLGGYVRVSRVGERDERLRSPDFQRTAILSKARAEGAAVEMFDAELDVSGSRKNRAVLDAIVARIEAGTLDGIIVYNLSRLSRLAPKDRIELVDRIESAGGVIVSTAESFDSSTPAGRFQRDLFFGIARMQWEDAAETFAVAKAAAIEAGRPVKAVAPFGFKQRAKGGGALELEPADAAIVVELFERRLAGASLAVLAEWFESVTGRTVPSSTVNAMLSNRAYLGELHYGRQTPLVNLEAHPAVVDVALFESVQALNEARSSGRGVAVNRAKSLLAGIAKCEGCGRGLVESATGSMRTDGTRGRSYKCPATTRRCSSRAHIPAPMLDSFVEDAIVGWLGGRADELVELELERGARGDRVVAEYRLAEAERVLVEYQANVELELEVGAEAYAAGRKARVELVESRRQELEAFGAADELEVVRSTLRDALHGETLEVDERRRLYAVVVDSVVVSKCPRAGAAAWSRARIVWTPPAKSTAAEDALELVA